MGHRTGSDQGADCRSKNAIENERTRCPDPAAVISATLPCNLFLIPVLPRRRAMRQGSFFESLARRNYPGSASVRNCACASATRYRWQARELLKEIVPGLSRVAMLINSHQQSATMYVDVTPAAAGALGITIQEFDAHSPEELPEAFDAMEKASMQAMLLAQGGTAFQWRAIVPKLAIEHRLPLCAFSRETFEYGALISYGPDQIEMCHRSAALADKILKGAKPSDIPVEQPTRFEFLINLKTAKALGLTIPVSMLATADQVVE